MNERIRELAEKAGMTEGRFERYKGQDCNLKGYSMLPDEMEKFAELIVRECAESLWTEECYTSDLALKEFLKNSKKINLHFGVE